MVCDICKLRLYDYIDGLLGDEDMARMREHIDTCPDCAAVYAEHVRMVELLRETLDEDPPEELHQRVMTDIRAISSKRGKSKAMKIGLGIAAGLVVLVGIPLAVALTYGMSRGFNGAYLQNTTGQVSPSANAMSEKEILRMAAGEMTEDRMKAMDDAYVGGATAYSGAVTNFSFADTPDTGAGIYDGASYDYDDMEIAEEPMAMDTAMAMATSAPQAAPEEGSGAQERQAKMIRNASVSMQSKTFDDDSGQITALIEELGGYTQDINQSGLPIDESQNAYGRYLYISARIPAVQYDAFIERVKAIGQVNHLSQYTEDVTDQYYDAQVRLETLKVQYERLTSILEKTVELSDVLALETEMSRVQYEIESMQGRLRYYDSRISYSTVSIDIQEVKALDRIDKVDPTLPERMRDGLVSTLNSMVSGMGDLVVFIVSALPVLLIAGAIITAVILIVRRSIRKRRQNRAGE